MAAVADNTISSSDRQFSPPPSSPSSDPVSDFRNGVRDLVNLLSKLNPSAEEFVPSSKFSSPISANGPKSNGILSPDAPIFVADSGNLKDSAKDALNLARRKKSYANRGRKINERVLKAQREDSIRRTVYVSDIDTNVTEEQLAALFTSCGQVVDCRVCGDPHSILRFAFIEFADEQGARAALNLGGTVLGYYPVRVLPSKTAILPVNPTFLPRSEDEREMCARTIYCTNIDKKVTQADVKAFFEAYCGEVSRLRLLGDHVHSTRIAFVEFVLAESALIALNCSGMLLGALPVRVSPSKTPVRPRVTRATTP
ncbi:polyadenylate-binding protein-interacting protein 9-like isoform X2 [Wolffia australiana]